MSLRFVWHRFLFDDICWMNTWHSWGVFRRVENGMSIVQQFYFQWKNMFFCEFVGMIRWGPINWPFSINFVDFYKREWNSSLQKIQKSRVSHCQMVKMVFLWIRFCFVEEFVRNANMLVGVRPARFQPFHWSPRHLAFCHVIKLLFVTLITFFLPQINAVQPYVGNATCKIEVQCTCNYPMHTMYMYMYNLNEKKW
jgi:hypothetical protein